MNNIPNAIELEEALLGTIIVDQSYYLTVCELINENCFFSNKHKNIYLAIKNLFNKSYSIDLLSVAEELKKIGKLEESGSYSYLSELTNKATYAIDYHARIIGQKYMQREMMLIGNSILQDAQDDTKDIFQLIDNANNSILKAQNILDNNSILTLENIKNNLLKMALSVRLGEINSQEIPSCVNFINFYLNTVTVIGAKPGTGKTAFLLSSANEQAKRGYKVMIVSLEMTKDRMAARILQSHTKIFAKRIISGDITDSEYNIIADTELSDNILIEEGIGWTSTNFKSNLIRLYKKYKFDIVYVDYFQKIPLIGKDTVVNMQFYLMENQICAFAKEYPVSVCLLSQLNRGEDKGLEGLRGGGIEQGASQVYIFTDEYIIENKNLDFMQIPEERRGKISVNCEKNRDDSYLGGTIYFDKLKQTMTDWSILNNQQETEIF
jgi:replicative DNA helicase